MFVKKIDREVGEGGGAREEEGGLGFLGAALGIKGEGNRW